MRFLKLSFYISNLFLFIFYLYPGSISGCFLYNDCNIQPQLTRDFIIFSSNHVYVFIIFSLLGILSFKKDLIKAFSIKDKQERSNLIGEITTKSKEMFEGDEIYSDLDISMTLKKVEK